MLDFLAERKIQEAQACGEFDAELERIAMGNATAVKKLALLKARVETRYYEKALARLAR